MKPPAMTPDQARSFDRVSVGNATLVLTVLKCGCHPYEDVFTYKRWQAQGFQVQRGEKAISLPLVKEIVEEDEGGETIEQRRILGHSWVFCRCQVKPIEGS